MKKTLFFLSLFLLTAVATSAQDISPKYNKSLADSLGADDYGMKSYVLVILKTGENTSTEKEKINDAFRGHMENINHLVAAKKMIVAGPLGKNSDGYRGIFILDTKSIDEAKELVKNDPAVQTGFLTAEYYEWYGSAALPLYLEAAAAITKVQP